MEWRSYKRHSEWIIDNIVCRCKIVHAATSSMEFMENMMNDLGDAIKAVGASDRDALTELLWQQMYYEAIFDFIAVGMDWEDDE